MWGEGRCALDFLSVKSSHSPSSTPDSHHPFSYFPPSIRVHSSFLTFCSVSASLGWAEIRKLVSSYFSLFYSTVPLFHPKTKFKIQAIETPSAGLPKVIAVVSVS